MPIRAVSAAASSVTIGSWPTPVRVIVGLLNTFPTVTPRRTLCPLSFCLHSALGHPSGGRPSQDHTPASDATTAIEGGAIRKAPELRGDLLREKVGRIPHGSVGRDLGLVGRVDPRLE